MKKYWGIIRTVLFLFIGIKNTLFIDSELVGSWENYLGYLLLVIGILDGFSLVKKYLGTKI